MKVLKKLYYVLLMFTFVLATAAGANRGKEFSNSGWRGASDCTATAEAAKVKAPGGVIAVVDADGNLMAGKT